MTRRDWAFFTVGSVTGLWIWAYLIEKTLVGLPKLSNVQAGAAFFPVAQPLPERTYGSIVGGTRSERAKWFTGDPAT